MVYPVDNIQLINSCYDTYDNWITYRSILFHGSHRGRIAASPRAIPLATLVAAIVDQTDSQKRSSRVTPIIARDNATYRSPFPHVTPRFVRRLACEIVPLTRPSGESAKSVCI